MSALAQEAMHAGGSEVPSRLVGSRDGATHACSALPARSKEHVPRSGRRDRPPIRMHERISAGGVVTALLPRVSTTLHGPALSR